MDAQITRKQLLQAGAAGAAAASLASLFPEHVARALAAPAPACASLADIEHVVILIQENRSFDNYFGTYPGVRGFSDPTAPRLTDGSGLSVFAQPGYPVPGYGGHLMPFRLDTQNGNGECTNDITHDWGPQHRSFNGGRMDRFVAEHLQADGAVNGPLTMGYYERADLAYYHALADAFTLCDGYHCSVLGPTDPNRLYTVSATLDPAGAHGGPILKTDTKVVGSSGTTYNLTWTTMPEQLRAAGVSWKIYGGPDANAGDNVLLNFSKFRNDADLAANAFTPTFPGTFQADAASGALPQVSWVLAPLVQTEHPPAAPVLGEYATSQVLSALTANPDLWAKTVLLVTWDENGGFFDHVPPPVAPAGTPDEFLSVSTLPASAEGIRGPIGLGFRVPLLVISPFSRGGFVCSDTFDHTSTLRFLESRFGVEVPNLSEWRRSVTGDLTSALNLVAPDRSIPAIIPPSPTDPALTRSSCPVTSPISEADENAPVLPPYPIPPNHMPAQEPGTRQRPSGECAVPGQGSGGAAGTLPAAGSCVDTRGFSFRLHRPHGRRIVRVDAYVNGRHVRTLQARRGHTLTRLTLPRLPEGRFTLRIVVHTDNRHRVVTVRAYHGCTKGAPHTAHHRRVHHHRAPR